MSLKLSAKASKPSPLAFDQHFNVPVCGIDEAGRGPLAGPVVAACVYIPPDQVHHPLWHEVTDSKKLTHQKREYLYPMILERCVYGIAEANVDEIDTLNIHHATLLAMKRAYETLSGSAFPEIVLVDGKFTPALPCKTQAVIKGDSLSLCIGAASILAKVTRDRVMARLHQEYPHYHWDTNMGYGTAEHLAGLKKFGITAHHRKSYAPCQERKEVLSA